MLGRADEIGPVEVGKQADLVLVDENPLANLKMLCGTGALRFNKKTPQPGAGGVDYTTRDGIVSKAERLLQDVEQMVRTAKKAAGIAPDADLTRTE